MRVANSRGDFHETGKHLSIICVGRAAGKVLDHLMKLFGAHRMKGIEVSFWKFFFQKVKVTLPVDLAALVLGDS